jgi:pimeloyl-ACP methyl ester carboxylesterase
MRRRGYFWVGIERVSTPDGTVARGPMYVEWEEPAEPRRPYPVVLVHGGGGQGTDYLGTPDGRPGWASYLVEEGYSVYVVDRPGHGRASFHPDVLGQMGPPYTYERAMNLFTAAAKGPMNHPTAHLYTQWPGSGEIGDPSLDMFVAAQGPRLQDQPAAHALEQSRGVELLDRIGPAILLTHSAGGPLGWLVADARPELVKGIVAVEPIGPPFAENRAAGVSLRFGLTAAPLSFDPPARDPSELLTVTREPDQPGAPPLTLQAEPARRLPNLSGIPTAVVSAEASYLGHQDGHTVEFLRQAGCGVDHLRLGDHGVHGNGHLMMLERNNREVLQVILDWLEATTPAESPAAGGTHGAATVR